MTPPSDPFAHHPELRGRIDDPYRSFFRDFSVEGLMARFPQLEEHRGWVYSDAVREAMRAEALRQHSGDLWVFAYGSLMWDPALDFAEVRRARLQGYARRMILVDARGGRGTAEAPGLMAALDEDPAFGGPGDPATSCEGLVFRIPAEAVDRETEILWRREIVGPAYIPRFVDAHLDQSSVKALTFVADHAVPDIQPELSRADQVRLIATGAGFLGSSRDYLANIVRHFEAMGIHDPDCASLFEEVEALRASLTQPPQP